MFKPSALLRGFQYIIFLVAGLLTAVNAISNAENAHNIFTATHPGETDQTFIDEINSIQAGVEAGQLRIAGILIVVVLVGAIVAAYLLMHFGYTIDEKKHQEIVDALEARKQQTEAPQE